MPLSAAPAEIFIVQNVEESRMKSPTKSGSLTHPLCRKNPSFAADLRQFSDVWPRALARGLSWSVHVGFCFWNMYPGLLIWIFEITW